MGNDIILYSHLKFQYRRLESDGTMCSNNHPNDTAGGNDEWQRISGWMKDSYWFVLEKNDQDSQDLHKGE
ncbi:hypothetical protein TNCV_10141 [Trichonephila clavipes]|nr:hypothetical protein TNCV_10141 [Trichonephila clavipes]